MKYIGDKLNIRALRLSKSRKHNSIHKKASQMIIDGWKTKELSEFEILEMASMYQDLDISIMIGGIISVKSKKDSWLIRDEVRFFSLYHKSWEIANGKMRESYHIQDVFYDLEYVFASIESHDDYTLGIKERGNQDLLEKLEMSV